MFVLITATKKKVYKYMHNYSFLFKLLIGLAFIDKLFLYGYISIYLGA
jgi:hypothetical protein